MLNNCTIFYNSNHKPFNIINRTNSLAVALNLNLRNLRQWLLAHDVPSLESHPFIPIRFDLYNHKPATFAFILGLSSSILKALTIIRFRATTENPRRGPTKPTQSS